MSDLIKTILYTTALGPHTRPVFRFAVNLTREHNAKMVLLHVVEPLTTNVRFLIDSYLAEDKAQELHREATSGILDKFHKRLEAFCAEELGSTLQETTLLSEIRVVSGLPCEVILEEAERCNADLIIVGSHSGVTRRTSFIGSTSRRLTLLSKRPVLIVPTNDSTENQWAESLV